MICKKILALNLYAFACALFILSIFTSAPAQTEPPATVVTPKPPGVKAKVKKATQAINESSKPAEKSIAVNPKVNVSLCVSDGKIKINGWDRSEIRAFVDGGSEVGFKVVQKNSRSEAVWVKIVGFDPAKNTDGNFDECLSGEDIEIDVPRGATVSVKGQASEAMIDSVNKVSRVEIIGGNIFLDNIAEGIEATTYQGSITVQNSGGAITLGSTTGNIVAFDVAPSEIGDIFKAKTNSGAITLQKVEHRQMEINSSSGAIKFVGAIQNGGQYTLGTLNGSIQMLIPEKTSCKINALYGYGNFNSDFKLKVITINNTSKAQSLVGSIGDGDANVNLTTYNGAIRIKKQ